MGMRGWLLGARKRYQDTDPNRVLNTVCHVWACYYLASRGTFGRSLIALHNLFQDSDSKNETDFLPLRPTHCRRFAFEFINGS